MLPIKRWDNVAGELHSLTADKGYEWQLLT